MIVQERYRIACAKLSSDRFHADCAKLHVVQDVQAQCARLEQELRKSKRREEKLTALQYRLKEDVRLMGADSR